MHLSIYCPITPLDLLGAFLGVNMEMLPHYWEFDPQTLAQVIRSMCLYHFKLGKWWEFDMTGYLGLTRIDV